ncbi:hypothetical protein INT48_005491 [Thamnidium elegans]|uniref:Uncharacterized protein n=1 Tax=Thamnidium elegans TaxID=101142 RepID=A0A8H7W2F0_9FUNG|nr:hypothetical protein INT48_005491 [Thamnidium elegans]
MSEVPVGWFYVQCPSRQDQVLTVSSMSMKSSIRVELRPKKKIGVTNNHQLWCYNQGYLVNKHSGCGKKKKKKKKLKRNRLLIIFGIVLGVEKDKLKGQFIFQSKKVDGDAKKQVWKYDEEKRLVLTGDDTPYALNDLAVPKLDSIENGCSWVLCPVEQT